MKLNQAGYPEQFKVRTGLRAGDNEDCAKGFQEFVEKCNLSANPDLMAKLTQQLAEAGINIGTQAAQSGASIGAQWAEFGRSFIP